MYIDIYNIYIVYGLVEHSQNNYFYNMDLIDFGYSIVNVFEFLFQIKKCICCTFSY